MVIFSSNALYSILSLVFIIISGCFILFLLEIEFLSFIILLLYIGAIAVLFLFVVMMIQLNKNDSKKCNVSFLSSDGLFYIVFGVKFFYFMLYFNSQLSNSISLFSFQFLKSYSVINYSFIDPLMIYGDSVIFLSIFTQKYFLFVLVAIILLFAMIGSILLCVQDNNK